MTDPIQEQLIAARKNQILDAAARVFAAKGFHPTTIKAIAREAGIADGTIYNYFKNKTALLFGIMDRMKEAALQDAPPLASVPADPHALLCAILRHPLHAFRQDDFRLFRVVMSEVMVNADLREQYRREIMGPTLAPMRGLLEAWAAQGVIGTLDVDLTMRAITGLVMGVLLQTAMGDELLAKRWDALPDQLADLLLDGLGA